MTPTKHKRTTKRPTMLQQDTNILQSNWKGAQQLIGNTNWQQHYNRNGLNDHGETHNHEDVIQNNDSKCLKGDTVYGSWSYIGEVLGLCKSPSSGPTRHRPTTFKMISPSQMKGLRRGWITYWANQAHAFTFNTSKRQIKDNDPNETSKNHKETNHAAKRHKYLTMTLEGHKTTNKKQKMTAK